MATYFVSTTGNDTSGSGTQLNPYRTIAKGISVMAPVDTLILRGGTYGETLESPPSGVSDASRTTVRSMDGETAIIRPTSGAWIANIQNRSWITLLRLVLEGNGLGNANGLRIGGNAPGCSHITFQSGVIRNGAGGSSGCGGVSLGPSPSGSAIPTDIRILDSEVVNWGSVSLDHGVYLSFQDSIIEGCHIYNCAGGHGIHHYFSSGAVVNNNIIRNNRIHNNGGPGIGLYRGTGGRIYNNLVYGNCTAISGAGGIVVRYSGNSMGVYNNTVYGNTGYGIWVDTGITNTVLRNNICYNNTSTAIRNDGTGTVQSNNLTTNPNFVSPAGGDFHIQSNSTARDTGTSLSSLFTTDFDGVTRANGTTTGTAWDIGALEYVSSAPPPPGVRYVSTSGSDSNPGTLASPWRTIAYGLAHIAGGDTLYVRGGTYNEAIEYNAIPAGLSDTQRTLVSAYNSEVVTLTGRNSQDDVISIYDRSYITVDGIRAQAGRVRIGSISSTGVPGAHYITYRYAKVDVSGAGYPLGAQSALGNGGISGQPHTHIHFHHLELMGGAIGNPDGSLSGTGLYVSGMADSIFEDLWIHDNVGSGIQQYNSANNPIVNNNIYRRIHSHNNGSFGLSIGYGDNTLVYNNLVHHNGGVVSGAGGIRTIAASSGNTWDNVRFFNNTVYANTGAGFTINAGSANTQIRNNIIYQNTGATISNAGTGTVQSNNLTTDPSFVAAASNNFHIQSGSAARETGLNLASVFTTDYDNVVRANGTTTGTQWDIGAYEYVSGTSPSPPAAPTGLAATTS